MGRERAAGEERGGKEDGEEPAGHTNESTTYDGSVNTAARTCGFEPARGSRVGKPTRLASARGHGPRGAARSRTRPSAPGGRPARLATRLRTARSGGAT